jgi:putative transposase
MLKTYRYKLNPNRAQRRKLEETLRVCHELYNIGLEQRRGQRISLYAQHKQLTEMRAELPEYKNVHVHVLQNVLRKLDQSYQNFFASGFGYPRFKSRRRYDSFRFNNVGFRLAGRYLSLSKIGNVKVRLSRELPEEAIIKTCAVKRAVDGWFATFTFEYEPVALPSCPASVGIDVGIEKFAALSDGSFIRNPRFYECGQAELRRAQRRVARRKKGSHRRAKAVAQLQKSNLRIANRRLDWMHKQTTALVRSYGTIAVENLNIKGLAQGILSKQIHDASWSMFFNLLRYKAEEAGRQLVEVDARHTSQTCPSCSSRKKKKLSQRKHECECGYTAHRDTAAAQVILARMEPLGAKTGVVNPCLA